MATRYKITSAKDWDTDGTLAANSDTKIPSQKAVKTYVDSKNSGWIPVSDSWAYASADSPTFTITVPTGAASIYSVGMRIKLTQTTVKYFIITAVADTVLTVYGGTDYTLINAAISAISYSTQKAPLGFPLSPAKWTVEVISSANALQNSPTQNQWYNLGSISINVPVGLWELSYRVGMQVNRATAGSLTMSTTLSTANNSESDVNFTSNIDDYSATAINPFYLSSMAFTKNIVSLAAKATYYLNGNSSTTSIGGINHRGDTTRTLLRAVCAYL